MYQRKVTRILESFSKTELRQAGLLVNSPFFNPSPDVTRLFELIVYHHPNFNPENLNREKLFRQLFPEKPYDDQVFRLLVSDLNKLMEMYLIQKELAQRPEQQNEMLLKGFNRKGLDDLFQSGVGR